MEQKTWKALAIVFICLFAAETIYFISVWNIGNNMLRAEDNCADECGYNEEAGFYTFDYSTRICRCMNKEKEVVKTIDLT